MVNLFLSRSYSSCSPRIEVVPMQWWGLSAGSFLFSICFSFFHLQIPSRGPPATLGKRTNHAQEKNRPKQRLRKSSACTQCLTFRNVDWSTGPPCGCTLLRSLLCLHHTRQRRAAGISICSGVFHPGSQTRFTLCLVSLSASTSIKCTIYAANSI